VKQALMTIACSFINVYDNQYGLSHCGEKSEANRTNQDSHVRQNVHVFHVNKALSD